MNIRFFSGLLWDGPDTDRPIAAEANSCSLAILVMHQAVLDGSNPALLVKGLFTSGFLENFLPNEKSKRQSLHYIRPG